MYGNVSKYFGKKREEDGHTHQWTVYVKPFRNEDMSAYVKKVRKGLKGDVKLEFGRIWSPNPSKFWTKEQLFLSGEL